MRNRLMADEYLGQRPVIPPDRQTDNSILVQLEQSGPIPLSLSLTCNAGEIVALVGPSGGGKTTVLRAIAGLYSPTTGYIQCQKEVWLDTATAINTPAHKRAVGMVFQHYALFPHFTALGNIMEALNHHPKKQRIMRGHELLKRVNLQGLEHRYPRELSGGQQQRVAVARALARDPKVLLLDEPFSAVDQITRRRLYRELTELRHSLSMPIILVTHDLEEATRLADRLSLLYRGTTLQSGTPLDVAAKPVSALAARLMDQQNLFTAQVIDHIPARTLTRLNWHGYTLDVAYQPDYACGQNVCWMIPAAEVLLHQRRQASNGERENPVSGTIIDYKILGVYVDLLVEINEARAINLAMSVPLHVAHRNHLKQGEQITVSLLAKGIHLMPFEQLRGERNHA